MNLSRQTSSRSLRAVLQKQYQQTIVVSFSVALLLSFLLLLSLALFSLDDGSPRPFEIKILSPSSQSIAEIKKHQKPRVIPSSRPHGPRATTLSQVLATNIPKDSPISIPVPSFDRLSFDLGTGTDFGEDNGWGGNLTNQIVKGQPDLAVNPGDNQKRGRTSFFGQIVEARRIVYVFDAVSGKMVQGDRWYCLIQEFQRVIHRLEGSDMLIGVIFYGGPAWSIGDTPIKTVGEFQPAPRDVHHDDVRGTIIRARSEQEFYWTKREGETTWEHLGEKQQIPWFQTTEKTKGWIGKVLSQMQSHKPLRPEAQDSVWNNALNLALDMKPPPEEIVFVASYAAPGAAKIWVEEIGQRAKSMGVKINCLGMKAPELESQLSKLAVLTGGLYQNIDNPLIFSAMAGQLPK